MTDDRAGYENRFVDLRGHGNALSLKALMREHALTRRQVALLLDVARQTVDSWLAPAGAPSHRNMPANMLRLLQFEIADLA